MQRKYRSFICLAAVALSALFIASCGNSGTESPGNTVAATVNGKKIMMSEVETLINQQMQGQQIKLGPVQLAQARLQVLDNLIQREVLVQRAEKENVLPTEDEITQYINVNKQQGGLTEEEFQKALKQQGQTEQGLREEAKKILATQKLQAKYTGGVNISDREVEDYYLNNKETFTVGRGVELAAIIVDPRDNGMQDDAKNETEAKQKIDDVHQRLKNGTGEFAELARSKSEDQNSNAHGGDIGFATEDDLKQNGFPPPVITQLFGPLQVGAYTDPVEFNGKWYIFKLKRRQLEVENRTLESQGVRQEITETLRNQHQQILVAALREVALRDAKIVNNFANSLLSNPSNLGLRPAGTEGAKPAGTPAAAATSSATPGQKAAASPASSPAKK